MDKFFITKEEFKTVAEWMGKNKIKSISPDACSILIDIGTKMLVTAIKVEDQNVKNILVQHSNNVISTAKLMGAYCGVVIEEFKNLVEGMSDE